MQETPPQKQRAAEASHQGDEPKSRYTPEELEEFEALIEEKLQGAKKELAYVQESLTRRTSNESVVLSSKINLTEDSMEFMERERLSQIALRQQRFIKQLENARLRIKNGTYGICTSTGKLIDKNRLRSVPHTTQSIEAKRSQSNP